MARPTLEPIALDRAHQAWLGCAAIGSAMLHVGHLPLWLIALAALMFAWRVALWWTRRPLPPRAVVTLLAFGGTACVLLEYHSMLGRQPGVALLVIFVALKLLEVRHTRDGWVVILLCYFLAFAVFLYSQTLVTALMVSAMTIVTTGALAALHGGLQTAGATLATAARLLAQAVPFTVIAFVLFPRVEGPLWGLPADAFAAGTGLDETMSPGSISQLNLSDAVAFRVQFAGTVPTRAELYWRGPVLTRFDGRTWHAVAANPSPPLREGLAVPLIDYTVTLEPHGRRWLFALEIPARAPPSASITRDRRILAHAPVHARLRYRASAAPGVTWGMREPAEKLLDNLQLPPDSNPRARALAQTWRRRAADDAGVVRAALDHFRREPFYYTLRPPLLSEQPVDEFLFESRRGFCEHYAGAFVFLMRAAGVPARVVTGYQGGETNPVDGYWVVRQSDAHAWAEVWLRPRGWVRVDPTSAVAPARVESGLAAAVSDTYPLPFMIRSDVAWLRHIRLQWEALSNTWNQAVLGYNQRRQADLLARLGMRSTDWREMVWTLAVLSALLVLALLPWTLRATRRTDPALAAWNRLSRKLRSRGLAREPWEGPLDYQRRLAEALPHRRPELEAIALLYVRVRYARHADRPSLLRLQTLIRRFDPGPTP